MALVEASWKLGDRWLKLSSPFQRGDDIDQLQCALLRLGFDCGRPDGIYGPLTEAAVRRFQRHCGLQGDGVCGPETVRTLSINSRQTGDGPGVAMLREMTRLSSVVDGLGDLRVVVGQFGGVSPVARQVSKSLRQHEANVLSIDEPDPSVQASVANHHGATAYIGFEASAHGAFTVCYFSAPSYESVGGRALAERMVQGVGRHQGLDLVCSAHGMRLPVLRETKMPAVLCSLWPINEAVTAAPLLTDAIVQAVVAWADSPLPVQR